MGTGKSHFSTLGLLLNRIFTI